MGINVLKGNVNIENYVEAGAKVEHNYYGTVYKTGKDEPVVDDNDNSGNDGNDKHTNMSDDERITIALTTIIGNNVIVHKYDYAMIMMILVQKYGKTFKSPKTFIAYLVSLGIEYKLPSDDTLLDILNEARNEYPNWNWNGKDATEIKRRNDVAQQFIAAYNKI